MARWAGGWRWTALLVVGVLVLVACEPPYFTGTGLDSRSATASEAVEVDPPEPVTLLRDCGLSVPLSDGGALWIFCDTTVPPATAPAVENSAAVAASANLAEPLDVLDGGGDPSQFITATSAWDDRCDPASADERRVRPLSASVFPYYWVDVVTVFFEHVCFSAGAEVGSGGIGVAQFFYDTTNPPTGALQATVLADYLWDGPTPTTAPGGGAPATEVMAGFGRVSGSDPVGFEVYVYRCQPDSVTGCQVGRVHAGSVASPAAYEWWDGTAFTAAIPDPGTAAMTVAGTSGSGEVTSIAWHPDMAKWVMSYLTWGPTPGHGSSVSLRVANNPTGRWSDPVTVTPAACAGDKCRDTYAHPALSSETSMAISYYSEPDAGGDGLVWTVDAEMFADGWIDVGPGDPDLDDLDRVKFWGIVAPNHPDYTFRPDDDTTRAEFAQMLWTVADKPATPPGS
ncbi:MAG: DUF4185 domain-containing protein, partial [Hyphomicrobiales bacterium]|nr:DUF4185 domain-containing protein [Hyphomicrobiales bacterium]